MKELGLDPVKVGMAVGIVDVICNRIEFRAFAGTLDKTKIVGYIQSHLRQLNTHTDRNSPTGVPQFFVAGSPIQFSTQQLCLAGQTFHKA